MGPSPTTNRILVKGLVDNGKYEKAMEMKEETAEKGLAPDPVVYSFLMFGCAKNRDSDEIFKLFEGLKENKDGVLEDGLVYGSLMNGYFMKGMENEAMASYEEACGENSKVKMSAVAYNYVLDALSKNKKFDEALRLFDKMKTEHNPSKLFGKKEGESESSLATDNTIDASSQGEVPDEEESEGAIEQATVMECVADSNAVDAKQPF
ncbi:hypothetical protein V6N13_086255 [Hibiscus sabdariffa]|uniref:Pentatricopeptide repeat-containing protein n=1 Tax=Hibiscus sabdariffa TaxID=183260 RepID=A0ABR2FSP1_9ROSI